MPLQTFLNLPEKRQKEIQNVCFREFALNDFESASLSRIIKALGLAKGSFYRYFTNKEELYLYLYEFGLKLLFGKVELHFKDPQKEFVEAWMDYFVDIIRLEADYPLYLRFLARVRNEVRDKIPALDSLIRDSDKSEIMQELLAFHQKQGDVRSDVDVNVLVEFLRGIRHSIRHYLIEKYNLDYSSGTNGEKSVFPIPDKELKKDLREFAKLMRAALRKKSSP